MLSVAGLACWSRYNGSLPAFRKVREVLFCFFYCEKCRLVFCLRLLCANKLCPLPPLPRWLFFSPRTNPNQQWLCRASQPQTTAISRAVGMREMRCSASCDPMSHSLVSQNTKLLLVFENIFWLLWGAGAASMGGKYCPFGALHCSIPEHPGLLTHLTGSHMSTAFLRGDLGSIAWEIIRRG